MYEIGRITIPWDSMGESFSERIAQIGACRYDGECADHPNRFGCQSCVACGGEVAFLDLVLSIGIWRLRDAEFDYR